MRAYDRWRSLDRRAKRLTLEAAALTALTVVRIRLAGAPRLHRASDPHRDGSASADDIGDLAASIARASRYVPGATCLPRALALAWMLRRRGIPADVQVGVRTDAGALRAHAWVECRGMTLNGPADGDPFVVLR